MMLGFFNFRSDSDFVLFFAFEFFEWHYEPSRQWRGWQVTGGPKSAIFDEIDVYFCFGPNSDVLKYVWSFVFDKHNFSKV